MSAVPLPRRSTAAPPAERRARGAALTAPLSAGLSAGLPALWQADQLAVPALAACPSGHAALDAELPGGGWPAAGLTELLLAAPGSGELRLLAPALARLGAERELAWIAPPCPPYAPALQALGLPLARTVWVDAEGGDAAWAAEQVLRSGSAGAVLWWSGERLPPAMLRRLHLAAQEGATPLFALRPPACAAQSSPAPLRLLLEPAPDALRLQLLKRRGPALARPLSIPLPAPALRRRRLAPTEDVVVGPAPALAVA